MKMIRHRTTLLVRCLYFFPILLLAACATRIPVQLNDSTAPTVTVRLADSTRFATYTTGSASGEPVTGDIDSSQTFMIGDPYFSDRSQTFPNSRWVFVFNGADYESGIYELIANLRFTFTCIDGRDREPSENLTRQVNTRREVPRRDGQALSSAIHSISFTMKEFYDDFCFSSLEPKPIPAIIRIRSVEYEFIALNHAAIRGEGRITGSFNIGSSNILSR